MLLSLGATAEAQKLIEYSSGIGSRDPENGQIWILFRGVKASHDGMTLRADSAHYNTAENSFTAFRHVEIKLTDTTFIYGDRLYYDGNSRILDIWADTVVLIDGSTRLKANHLTYERDRATGYYTEWGHATDRDRTLDSRQGQYNSSLKEFYIYNDVVLTDSSMRLVTDTLIYNTVTSIAFFDSPTYIYADSTMIYSEMGDYNTDTRLAISYRASHVDNQGRIINSDTLFYDEERSFGKAYGHVVIVDTMNKVTCTGRYGETSQIEGVSFVTDSALVVFVDDNNDTLYLHADTVYVTNDSVRHLQSVRAFYHVKTYRHDAQAMSDSAFYSASDSTLWLYGHPVLWYDHYQCFADTLELQHDTSGIKRVYLRNGCFAIQQVDREKFNQLKGHQGIVYFLDGEPQYADVIGNAEMLFYLTEEDSAGRSALLGVNAGMGTSIRIYFDTARAPVRVVTYDKPDMQTYPVNGLPEELKRLKNFQWLTARRPRTPAEVFKW